jgi:small subunit ribosomal protein S3
MGQKVNPRGFRVGVIKDWDSRWFVEDEQFGDTLVNDYNLRKMLKTRLYEAGVPKIEIERDAARVRVFIHCAKPGLIIGKGGTEIDKLKADIEKVVGKPVSVNVVEIKNPDMDAQLVAESIASQLERRIAFRRAMKQAIARTMKSGAKGIKTACGGRLNGAEIARTEHYHEGTIPLQTLRADIDYGQAEANTTYGKVGVKVWIYKGEVLDGSKTGSRSAQENGNRNDRRRGDRRDDRRGGRSGDRRGDRPDGQRSGERTGDRGPRTGERSGDRRDGQRSGDRRGNGRGPRAAEAPKSTAFSASRTGSRKPAAQAVAEAPAQTAPAAETVTE